MAEERITQDEILNHDDMTVLRVLMHEVRGINAVSTAPAFVADDDDVAALSLDFTPSA
jgi:hypothetical protein